MPNEQDTRSPDTRSPDTIALAQENWDRFGWGATDAMVAATSLTRMQQIMQRRIDAALAPFDLNFSRFEVLALLHFSRSGRLPMGKIGDRLQVHAASVTNTIQRLEALGFVERVRDDVDRRTILAELRPSGRAVVVDAAAALGEIDFGLDGMDRSDRRAVAEAGNRYREANGDFGTDVSE